MLIFLGTGPTQLFIPVASPCEALLFVDRIKQDYDSSQPAMRKAVSYTIGLQKHQACGAFLHFLRMFERLAPPADYDRAYVELHKMFLRGLLDADLQHVLTTSFPPGDLSAIAAFRQLAMNYNDLKFYLVTTLFLRFTASSF